MEETLDNIAVNTTEKANAKQNGEPTPEKKRKLGSWLAKSRPAAAMQEDEQNTPDLP